MASLINTRTFYKISHVFLTFSGGVVLTSIIINPIVLANSPSHSVLNLANCEGIEALISIWGLLNENDF